jgi:hypothetical protein
MCVVVFRLLIHNVSIAKGSSAIVIVDIVGAVVALRLPLLLQLLLLLLLLLAYT